MAEVGVCVPVLGSLGGALQRIQNVCERAGERTRESLLCPLDCGHNHCQGSTGIHSSQRLVASPHIASPRAPKPTHSRANSRPLLTTVDLAPRSLQYLQGNAIRRQLEGNVRRASGLWGTHMQSPACAHANPKPTPQSITTRPHLHHCRSSIVKCPSHPPRNPPQQHSACHAWA
jgi:hypothetical protein